MTVAELIEKLKEMPQDYPVLTEQRDEYALHVDNVRVVSVVIGHSTAYGRCYELNVNSGENFNAVIL